MNWSRTDSLEMRRRLLVIEASIQRLQLRTGLAAVAEEARPASLARRALAGLCERPSSFALPVAVAALMRGRSAHLFAATAMRLWRTWRRSRPET